MDSDKIWRHLNRFHNIDVEEAKKISRRWKDESSSQRRAARKKSRIEAMSIQTGATTISSLIEEISTDVRQSHGTSKQVIYEPAAI